MVESNLRKLEEMVSALEKEQHPELYPKTVEQYKKCVLKFDKLKTQKIKPKSVKAEQFNEYFTKCLNPDTSLTEAIKLKVSLLKYIEKEMVKLEEAKLVIHHSP